MLRVPRACLLLPLLVACATDQSPTAPTADPPDVPAGAFRLTIDIASGGVTVARSAGARRDGGVRPSLSLVGAEAVDLVVGACTWAATPNPRTRRCLLDIALENRLGFTDLVTPTTFPQPPVGTNGVLVFPFTSASLTASGGGSATATTHWDNAPLNFFNDVGCGKGANDCYRWELFEGPLYAGETSTTRQVGFDVDKSALSATAYIVVAADLRDNPPQTLVLASGPSTVSTYCGDVAVDRVGEWQQSRRGGPDFSVGTYVQNGATLFFKGFCSFALPPVLAGKDVAEAELRLYQQSAAGAPFDYGSTVIVDRVEIGVALDDAALLSPALQANIGTLSAEAQPGWRALNVTGAVSADLADGRPHSQFRVRLEPETRANLFGTNYGVEFASFGIPDVGASLVIRYRDP